VPLTDQVPEDILTVLNDPALFEGNAEPTTKDILKRYGQIGKSAAVTMQSYSAQASASQAAQNMPRPGSMQHSASAGSYYAQPVGVGGMPVSGPPTPGAPMGGPVHPGQAMPQMGAQWGLQHGEPPQQQMPPQGGPGSSIRPVGVPGGPMPPMMGVGGGMPGGGMGGPMMVGPPSGHATPSGMATPPTMNPDSAQPSPGMRQNAFRGNGFAGGAPGQGQLGITGAG
jgi:hypothetical protein